MSVCVCVCDIFCLNNNISKEKVYNFEVIHPFLDIITTKDQHNSVEHYYTLIITFKIISYMFRHA